MIRRILLVCTGNTCRSPMAEMMLRDMAGRRRLFLEVRSAGVAALDGQPFSENTVEVLRRRNIPIPPGAAASSLTGDAASWADLILTMTMRHKQMLLTLFPEMAGKTYTLKEYALKAETSGDAADIAALTGELDIADPFGGPLDLYERVAEEIGGLLERVLERLVSGGLAEAAPGDAGSASEENGTTHEATGPASAENGAAPDGFMPEETGTSSGKPESTPVTAGTASGEGETGSAGAGMTSGAGGAASMDTAAGPGEDEANSAKESL